MGRRNLTAEQKEAAAERLAVAREKRLKANPPKYSQYNQEVVNLPEDHPMSFKKVRQWIKNAKDRSASEKHAYRAGNSNSLARSMMWSSYANSLEHYLRTGDFIGNFYGENMEHKTVRQCIAMAYYPDGRPKRDIGVYYSDVHEVWTPELDNEERVSWGLKPLNYTPEGYIIVEGNKSSPKKKTKKKRTMTAAQKKALVERLRKGREAKAAKADK